VIEIIAVGNLNTGNKKIKIKLEKRSKTDDTELSFIKICAFLNI